MQWFRRWLHAYRTCNPPEGPLDPLTRFLVITRVCVISMTLTAALIGALLALRWGAFAWAPFLLVLLGLVAAHITNNLINDWLDYRYGMDAPDYPRAQYAPHPLLAGWITERGLVGLILALNLVDLGVLVLLARWRGWPVVAFALAGLFLSVFYVAPPLKLKYRGFGELSVFLVWGPLMIGGTFFVLTGTLTLSVLWASLAYGLLVTTVLVGKHLDKLEEDRKRGIRTLPVWLGFHRALRLQQVLLLAFFGVLLGAALTGAFLWPLVLSLLSLPRLRTVWQRFQEPRPANPPEEWPIWPLWYVGWAFWFTKRAGALLIAGLLLEVWFPSTVLRVPFL